MANPNLVETEELLAEIVRSAKTVAVVGMKGEGDADAPAHAVPKRVQSRGLRVIPVNPKLTETLGEKAYPDLASASVAGSFDMVNVFRRSEAIGQVADEVLSLPKERRPAVVWLQTGVRNDEAAEKLAREGIRVVQDRCLGVYVALHR
jgi:predicted CoA-binding protein